MKLNTLALAALIALAGPALAQTPPAKDTVKADAKKATTQDKKAAKTDKKDEKAPAKTEASPKK
jgi:hypothetical protein